MLFIRFLRMRSFRSLLPGLALLALALVAFVATEACDDVLCPAGQLDCGSNQCVDIASSRTNCGACGVACGAGQECVAGTCGAAIVCTGGEVACGGACVDPLASAAHCGATPGCGTRGGETGTACENALVCAAGTCAANCPQGLVACDGACIEPSSNRRHCGASDGCGVDGGATGTPCAQGLVCAAGACALQCPPDLVQCGDKCVDPETNRFFCGATEGCGVDNLGTVGDTCGAGEVCASGACGLSCQAGLVNCDGECIDPNTSRVHCGATASCSADAGTTGTVCDPGKVCALGTCSSSCPVGFVNCNGTCVDPQSDQDYCGATNGCGAGDAGTAGSACRNGKVCLRGGCANSCPAPFVDCGGSCVDPSADHTHCGATLGCGAGGMGTAGMVCNPGFVCGDGTCTLSCPSGFINCAGTCIDPNADVGHCGATLGCGSMGVGSPGTACGAASACVSGTCARIPLTSCKATLAAFPGTPDGRQTIDPDGSGPIPQFDAYCDMTYNDGTGVGGWTLIQSIVAPNGPVNLVLGIPQPGTSVYLPLATMQSLANGATQVHIRTPGMQATASATSVANTKPIVHLRAGVLLNDVSEFPQSQYWTGPFGTANQFDYTCSVSNTWPNTYHGCGTDAMHLLAQHARWNWSGGNTGLNTSFEIYVR